MIFSHHSFLTLIIIGPVAQPGDLFERAKTLNEKIGN